MTINIKNGAAPTQPRETAPRAIAKDAESPAYFTPFCAFFQAAKLAAEIEEHQKTRQQLREISGNQEGDQEHGESN